MANNFMTGPDCMKIWPSGSIPKNIKIIVWDWSHSLNVEPWDWSHRLDFNHRDRSRFYIGTWFYDLTYNVDTKNETEVPVTYNVDTKNEVDSASMWDNQHTSKIRETVPKTNNTIKKMFKLRKDFLTKIILLSLVIGRCATAKSIEGLTIESKIEKGN